MSANSQRLVRIYDMHCHTHEFEERELEEIIGEFGGEIIIVSVSEDVESYNRTVELSRSFPEHIVPCVGFHPWNLGEKSLSEAEELARVAMREGAICVGEVGLDKKFVPLETWSAQLDVFRLFLKAAAELDAYVTVHSPGAWREALVELVSSGVRKAMFHWYTGPLDLMEEIIGAGYYISINPALKIQRKHQNVAKRVPLSGMVLESDGPYNYRGLRLSPRMIPEAAEIIGQLKGISAETILEAASRNSMKLLYG